ncbi:MAG: ABC transporter ATP-binding protein [Thermodesulfovibrionales bacterium]
MPPELILETKSIKKFFGHHRVLEDITFQMGQGQIVGIVGENGSGKSTLLKILAGLLPPTSGELHIEGRVGFCPQDPLLFETLTVRENFRYFATAYGLDKTGTMPLWESVKRELLDRFHFYHYENRIVSELSGGTKQKLNLSLALLHSPDTVLLDEPYSGFDWETYLNFWQYAEEQRSKGKGIIVVTHFVYERAKFDTLFELKEGILRCV